jgi:hypothetical protein
MSLCVRRPTGSQSVSNPRRSKESKGTTQIRNLTGQNPTVPPIAPPPPYHPPWHPVNPIRWNLPPIMYDPDIIAHTLDFEKRLISWTITYSPESNISGVSNTTTTANNLISGNQVKKCPPLVDEPILTLGYQFPYTSPKKVTKTLTVSCDDDPEAFASFIHPGESGLDLLTAPRNYSGKFAEDFFMDRFIDNNASNVTLPPGYGCITSVLLCLESTKGAILRAVTITPEVIQYNLDINGLPATLQSARGGPGGGDDNVILDQTAPPFNFNSIPPALEESLGALADSVDRAVRKAPQEPKKQPSLPPGDGDATNDEEAPVCGFTPDVSFQDIMSLLMFNYSFFSEKIIDLLFMRLWAICEFVFWVFWNIIPLCKAEWDLVLGLIKKIFSIDFEVKDGACIPPFLLNLAQLTIDKILVPATCCNLKELLRLLLLGPAGLLFIAPLFQGCVVYWLVCFLRFIRNLFAYILLFAANFILWAITYGAKIICGLISGKGKDMFASPTSSETKSALKDEIAQMEKLQQKTKNSAGI